MDHVDVGYTMAKERDERKSVAVTALRMAEKETWEFVAAAESKLISSRSCPARLVFSGQR